MIRRSSKIALAGCLFVGLALRVNGVEVRFDLSEYREQAGLKAELDAGALTVHWSGADGAQGRIAFAVEAGIPTVRNLSIRAAKGEWQPLGEDLQPMYHVVSGVRRVTQQQTEPLEELGIPLTAETLDEIKWDAFWDAPLFVEEEGDELPTRTSSIPAMQAFANHPGMPRNPSEIDRSDAVYSVSECKVRTNGGRLEIVFEGVEAGIFSGYLQYDIFKGSNLIRQMLVAKTDQPSAAFKYESGLSGFPSGYGERMVWRDLGNRWQAYRFGGPAHDSEVVARSSNRVIAADLGEGSIAAFPPPHSFYWARETEQNLGYSWYRKSEDGRFGFGVRQAESEEIPEFYQNFALYSARPGKWQRMPLFLYVSPGSGEDAVQSALAFTRGDRFKALPGFKVMSRHFHVGLVKRLKASGGFDQRLNDVGTMKSVGVDIFEVIDGARGPGRHDRGELFLNDLDEYYEAARRQSDVDFLVAPNDENSTGGRPPFLGGHYDIILSRPLYWRPGREEGEPLREQHLKYGTVYNLGSPADMMEMTELENAIISMPHPRSKRSTGYPEAIWDTDHFKHENYIGLGYRWGMGIDASERRLGEYRFLALWDETNNQMAKSGAPLKFAQAISEARSDKGGRGKPSFDDVYGMSPVNYLKIDHVPTVDDMSPIVDAFKSGDYFVTSGEILIPSWEIIRGEAQWTVVADLEWTYPLEFVEVVWGDGETIGRKVISTTDRGAFGSERFEARIDIEGKRWIRFAAWDVATNGAMLQPVYVE